MGDRLPILEVMRITDDALKEFAILLHQDYPNQKFTKEEIREAATRVMRAVTLVYRPIPSKKCKESRSTAPKISP